MEKNLLIMALVKYNMLNQAKIIESSISDKAKT